jgi:signal transduction histidine kinase
MVDLTGYRILQEALTNVARHCGPTQVRATVRYGEGEVTIEVVDDGPTAVSSPPLAEGAHHGLVGIGERVAALGGRFQAGPSGRGFRVFACLPLPTAP